MDFLFCPTVVPCIGSVDGRVAPDQGRGRDQKERSRVHNHVSKGTTVVSSATCPYILLRSPAKDQYCIPPDSPTRIPCPNNVTVIPPPRLFLTSLLITSIMRIFDVYEHPTFEVEQADKATVRTAMRRLGVGATVSAIAAISFWGYYWSDSSPPSLFISSTALLTASHRL